MCRQVCRERVRGRAKRVRPPAVDRQQLLEVLDRVRSGALAPAEAARLLGELPYSEVAHAVGSSTLDHHRVLRTGIPEIVYGQSKTAEQIADTLGELARVAGCAIATRVDADKAAIVGRALPAARYHALARIITIGAPTDRPVAGPIAVVCAGTSDLAVAEEAALVAEYLGAPITRVHDVGVAGIHRLLARIEEIREAEVVIAIAGMEAALPSVLGGLIDRPLISVPTSVGYGVSIDGLVALAAMLTSCAPGITVVNIDNGVGAAVAAVKIARLAGGPNRP